MENNKDILISTYRDNTLHLRMNVADKKNALSFDLLSSLEWEIANIADSVSAIIISGGDKYFSAGADFNDLTGTKKDAEFDEAVSSLVRAIQNSPAVVFAAIEGPCIGAAVDVALSCDVRVGSEDSCLHLPAISLGLLYNPSAINRLVNRYTPDVIRQLILTGKKFDAHTAASAGLFNYVVNNEMALEKAYALTSAINAGFREAMSATKQLFNDCAANCFNSEEWMVKQLAILESEARKVAVSEAHKKHKAKAKEK